MGAFNVGGRSIFYERPSRAMPPAQKALRAARRSRRKAAGFSGTFVGGRSIFAEGKKKSAARSAAAKARAPAKGSPEAMAMMARLRKIKAQKRVSSGKLL